VFKHTIARKTNRSLTSTLKAYCCKVKVRLSFTCGSLSTRLFATLRKLPHAGTRDRVYASKRQFRTKVGVGRVAFLQPLQSTD